LSGGNAAEKIIRGKAVLLSRGSTTTALWVFTVTLPGGDQRSGGESRAEGPRRRPPHVAGPSWASAASARGACSGEKYGLISSAEPSDWRAAGMSPTAISITPRW